MHLFCFNQLRKTMPITQIFESPNGVQKWYGLVAFGLHYHSKATHMVCTHEFAIGCCIWPCSTQAECAVLCDSQPWAQKYIESSTSLLVVYVLVGGYVLACGVWHLWFLCVLYMCIGVPCQGKGEKHWQYLQIQNLKQQVPGNILFDFDACLVLRWHPSA